MIYNSEIIAMSERERLVSLQMEKVAALEEELRTAEKDEDEFSAAHIRHELSAARSPARLIHKAPRK